MRRYHLKRYYKLLQEAKKFLGNKCKKCSKKIHLSFDHMDRNKKEFNITKGLLTFSKEKLFKELKKCQLLCRYHHLLKTLSEQNKKYAKGTHGTISSYRYCKCIKCKKAKQIYMKLYNLKRKEYNAGVAKLVKQRTCNAQTEGSIPSASS